MHVRNIFSTLYRYHQSTPCVRTFSNNVVIADDIVPLEVFNGRLFRSLVDVLPVALPAIWVIKTTFYTSR